MQRNNPRYKLDHSQVEEARRRYEDDGWKILWISVYFNVKNGNIHFHVKSKGWVRKVKVVKRMPEVVAEIPMRKYASVNFRSTLMSELDPLPWQL
jgi:hypothetical protein